MRDRFALDQSVALGRRVPGADGHVCWEVVVVHGVWSYLHHLSLIHRTIKMLQ